MALTSPKHHLLIFGGTGACGQLFVTAALQLNYKLTLYIRTPSKLPSTISSHPNITIIQGELSSQEGLQEAASCGADIFISFAGPTLGRREGTPITQALQTFYPLLLAANPKIRILILSTASHHAPQDTSSLKWFLGIQVFIRGVGGSSYAEISGISDTTTSLPSDVEWTLFRVPLLKGTSLSAEQESVLERMKNGEMSFVEEEGDGNGKGVGGRDRNKSEEIAKVNAGFVGDKDGKDWLILDRGRLVLWILGEIEERRWIRMAPTLANASWW